MKAVIGLVIIALAGKISTDKASECNMAAFYMDLGCEPDSSTEDFCPNKYTCPDLHPDPTKCFYKGEGYDDNMAIPQTRITNPCSKYCYCSVYNGAAQIFCAAMDCYENMDRQCTYTYKLDTCCSTGKVCDKDVIAKLKTCIVDGRTYLEGERFNPPMTYKACICTAEWDGSVNNKSYCRDFDCDSQLYQQNSIQEFCAPVFFNSMRSCPIEFECPTSTSKVLKGLNLKELTGQCVFGNLTLTIGDEVTVEHECTKCTCEIPPFVSCLRTDCK